MSTAPWRKSGRSASGASACVEARTSGAATQLSDSKLPGNRPILELDRTNYNSLLSMIKTGELDQH